MSNPQSCVLVAEDDARMLRLMQRNLELANYRVLTAQDGMAALDHVETKPCDLLLLDIMMPKMDGLEVCRRVREFSAVPIIMVTARNGERDVVLGLDAGADDYLTKPFGAPELLARVRAVLRRSDESAAARYEDGRLVIDFADMRVTCDGEAVRLTRKEFSLLATLARGAGRVATRQQLLDNVWGYEYYGDTRTLDVHIRRLRQKLGPCGDAIETVVGVGYRFVGVTGDR